MCSSIAARCAFSRCACEHNDWGCFKDCPRKLQTLLRRGKPSNLHTFPPAFPSAPLVQGSGLQETTVHWNWEPRDGRKRPLQWGARGANSVGFCSVSSLSSSRFPLSALSRVPSRSMFFSRSFKGADCRRALLHFFARPEGDSVNCRHLSADPDLQTIDRVVFRAPTEMQEFACVNLGEF